MALAAETSCNTASTYFAFFSEYPTSSSKNDVRSNRLLLRGHGFADGLFRTFQHPALGWLCRAGPVLAAAQHAKQTTGNAQRIGFFQCDPAGKVLAPGRIV